MKVTIKHTNGGLTVLYNTNLVTEGVNDVKVYQDSCIINKYREKEYDEVCYEYSKDELVYLEMEENGQAVRWWF